MAKIMLVEDDNNLREIYEARLQAEGYTIASARDGEEALVVAKAEKPDLIISDVMMPKISGFEMLDILRNTEGLKEVKVIMLTALGQNDDQQRADKLGADRYLVKSQVTLEDIVKATHDLLGDAPEGEGESGGNPPAGPTAPAPDNPAPDAPAPNGPVNDNPTDTSAPVQPAASTAQADDDKLVADAAAKLAGPAEPAEPASSATPPPTPSPEPSEPTATPSQTIPVAVELADTANDPSTQPVPEPADDAPPEPMDEPAAEPAVEPSPEPEKATPEPAADSEAEVPPAQSSAQEEAIVENQIEDFVTGAASDVSPAPEPPAQDQTQDETPGVVITPTEPQPDTADDTPMVVAEPPKPEESSHASSVIPSKKKIIMPPSDQPKKSLDELLALEEAKEAGQSPAPAADPVVAANDDPAPTEISTPNNGPSPAVPSSVITPTESVGGKADPGSIAL